MKRTKKVCIHCNKPIDPYGGWKGTDGLWRHAQCPGCTCEQFTSSGCPMHGQK